MIASKDYRQRADYPFKYITDGQLKYAESEERYKKFRDWMYGKKQPLVKEENDSCYYASDYEDWLGFGRCE